MEIRLDDDDRLLGKHSMGGIATAPRIAPCRSNLPPALASHAHLGREGRGVLADLMERFEKDGTHPGDVELIGRYLFDCLLGQEAWQAVLEEARRRELKVVELALSWSADDHVLHRLSWETMHDGTDFLSVNADLAVAVVRIVSDAAEDVVTPDPAPARMLFALGAELHDPRIRPGAEVVGLLRGVEREGSPIVSMVMDKVTLSRLSDACRKFKPNVVHFVSHGELGENERGEIQLHPEGEDSGMADGEKLLRALGSAPELPSLVMLTGCDSAAAGEHMDSLAAYLVKNGIPIVIGMAGKIADPVCRLFGRQFGIALNTGEQLVDAITHGRRAGLQKQEQPAADDRAWTLPSIYMAPGVAADHAPIDVTASSIVARRISSYGLRREPVFCGRQDFGLLFDDLLDDREDLQALVAYTAENDGRKLGKTRLLHEFAIRALWAGQVVVMIDDLRGDPKALPSSSVQLGGWLLEAIGKTRLHFGLDEVFSSVLLKQLLRASGEDLRLDDFPADEQPTELADFLGRCKATKENGDALASTLGKSLIADLKCLMAELRGRGDDSIDSRSRPVLVLGGIGHWGSASDLLLEKLMGPQGMGEPGFAVPVFATGSLDGDSGSLVRHADTNTLSEPWIKFKQLTAFVEDEDTLAYQWVLLHPWNKQLPHADKAYAPNPYFDEKGKWRELFGEAVEGVPGMFNHRNFYFLAHVLATTQFFVSADDDDILGEYVKAQ